MYEMLPWFIVQSLNVYSVDNKKQRKSLGMGEYLLHTYYVNVNSYKSTNLTAIV